MIFPFDTTKKKRDNTEKRSRTLFGASSNDELLEESFVFPAEESYFGRTKESEKEADEPVSKKRGPSYAII